MPAGNRGSGRYGKGGQAHRQLRRPTGAIRALRPVGAVAIHSSIASAIATAAAIAAGMP